MGIHKRPFEMQIRFALGPGVADRRMYGREMLECGMGGGVDPGMRWGPLKCYRRPQNVWEETLECRGETLECRGETLECGVTLQHVGGESTIIECKGEVLGS